MLVFDNLKISITGCELTLDKQEKNCIIAKGWITNQNKSKAQEDLPPYVMPRDFCSKCTIYGEKEELEKLYNLYTLFKEISPYPFSVRLKKLTYVRLYRFNNTTIPCLYYFDYVFEPKAFTNMLSLKAPKLLKYLKVEPSDIEQSDDDILDEIEEELENINDDMKVSNRVSENKIKDDILKNALK